MDKYLKTFINKGLEANKKSGNSVEIKWKTCGENVQKKCGKLFNIVIHRFSTKNKGVIHRFSTYFFLLK